MKPALSFVLLLSVAGTFLPVSLAGGPTLFHHEFRFELANTGGGVGDGRLRFHIDRLAVPGEIYYFDNIELFCGEDLGLIVDSNFDVGGLLPWKFYTNALPDPPTATVTDGMVKITFGSDGPNTQLFLKDLVLPEEGRNCRIEFDACSTGGPSDPGYGNNSGLELIKHGPPYTKYGLDLSGNPPNAELSIHSCTEGATCGDGDVDPGEDCEPNGIFKAVACNDDCTFSVCGDGKLGPDEQCDDGGTLGGDGCDSNCDLEAAICGDGIINAAAGEECDPGMTKGVPVYCNAQCLIDTETDLFNILICNVFSDLQATPVPAICSVP